MARGFLSGVIWGGVVSVAGAGIVSVLADGPVRPDVVAQAPAGSVAPVPGDASTAEAVTDADLVRGGGTGQAASPKADDVSAAVAAGADTPQVPVTGEAEGLSVPGPGAVASGVAVDDVAPVLPSPQAALPAAPDAEGQLSISTDPAQPPAPVVPDSAGAFAGTAEGGGLSQSGGDAGGDTGADSGTDAGQSEGAEVGAERGTEGALAAEIAADPVQPAASDTGEMQTGAGGASEPDGPRRDGDQQDGDQQDGDQQDTVAALPSALDPVPEITDRPSIGRPAVLLIERDTDPQTDTAGLAVPPETADLPPIQAFAEAFENSDDKPLMAIILIDSGVDLTGGPVGLAALQSFPYPLNFAVDARLADAGARMADYRSQGFEVLALLDLPQGATAADAEVSLAAALDAVPQAVGVMEGVGTGVQDSRDASDQITEALRASGHGLVLQSKGLNTAQKLAIRDGVPAGLVFRDFDSAGQTPTVIRRFLDQAAFRAGQEGGVIMLGRVRPDTISALLLWGLQDRAERVALAPISAVLRTLVDP
jgi:polysaccharide deacetylase 2 family uncharacterized protein YibQ